MQPSELSEIMQNQYKPQVEFTFKKGKGSSLDITARVQGIIYKGSITDLPLIELESIKQMVQKDKDYSFKLKTNQKLCIQIGKFMTVELKCDQQVLLYSLAQNVQQLQIQLSKCHQTNTALSDKIDSQSVQILSLIQTIKELVCQQQKYQQKLTLMEDQVKKLTQQKSQQPKLTPQSINSLTNKLSSYQQQINQLKANSNSQKNQIQNLTQITSQQRTKLQSISSDLYKRSIPKSEDQQDVIFDNSRIIQTNQDNLTVQEFFYNRRIKNVQLIYRASYHGFDVKKFHEMCQNIPNTLFVCLTQFGKKIGGFTPLPWCTQTNSYPIKDINKQSFIFSLTHGDKFTLQNDKAIYTKTQIGPFFGYNEGSADIQIHDKANANKNSGVQINNCYFNGKYKRDEKESYVRFCGSENKNFRVQQWEVWRLQLS